MENNWHEIMVLDRSDALQATRFGIVGIVATLVHLAVAQIALAIGMTNVFAANTSGFLVAFCVGWAGHYRFTFQRSGGRRRSFLRYGVIALLGFTLNSIVLAGLAASDLIRRDLAVTMAILIVPVFSYLASRLWAFAKS